MEESFRQSFDLLLQKLQAWLNAIIANLPNFLVAILVFVIVFWIARKLKKYISPTFRSPDTK